MQAIFITKGRVWTAYHRSGPTIKYLCEATSIEMLKKCVSKHYDKPEYFVRENAIAEFTGEQA